MDRRSVNVRILISPDCINMASLAAELTGATLSVMEADRVVTDIIAMPTDLVVLDASMISLHDWNSLREWATGTSACNIRFLIAGKAPNDDVIPDELIIREPFSTVGIARAIRQVETIMDASNIALTYDQLLTAASHRIDEVQNFENFLREETSWLTAPASTRFHMPSEGGLVAHSLNVANTLLKLRALLAPDISEESCVICGLYHDIGKIGMPGKPYYLPNPSEWHVKNRGINYIVNKGLVHMDIATRSLFLVSRYITLTEEEAQAIRYHDGQYVEENKTVAQRETKLTRLLQYADNWSGGVLEERQ